MKNYLFISERMGFRNWTDEDKPKIFKICADSEVMRYFPNTLTKEQTNQFVEKMQNHFVKNGFCYFAVDKLEDREFIGFIGILNQDYKADFTPCVDIGWRLAKKEWGKGYATEGAKRCLLFAFNTIGLENIKAVCPEINLASENVMKKIGMKKIKSFQHPLLEDYKELETCLLYEIDNRN